MFFVYLKRLTLLLFTIFFPVFNVFADINNKSAIEYFTDNIFIYNILHGDYYSLAAIAILVILLMIFKALRRVFLSILLAILGIFMLVFAFESLHDFRWLPS